MILNKESDDTQAELGCEHWAIGVSALRGSVYWRVRNTQSGYL